MKPVLLAAAIVLTASIFFQPAIAQKQLPEFGSISKEELEMKKCSFDEDAVAMKLFDVIDAEFEPSAFAEKVRSVRRVRIKIFNEKGYQHATVRLPYYTFRKNTKVSDLKGIVYTLDGQGKIVTHNIEEADFFKNKATENVGVVSFTFPNIKPGAVLEYTYTLTEKGTHLDSWMLSDRMPTAYASYSVNIPAYSAFRHFVFNNAVIEKKFESITKGFDRKKTTFYKDNIPALVPEPYMSSMADNALRVVFVLFPGGDPITASVTAESLWKMVASQILKSDLLDEQYRKVIPGTEKIVDTAKGMRYAADKIKYLYRVIKTRIPDRKSLAIFPDDIGDAWKKRSGSAAEINMILINLLKRSNVVCHPVLVSTRENGKINTEFPSLGQFNNMDILVEEDDGTNYLIDASLRFQPYNIPPMNILNREIFILDPRNIRWAMVTDSRPLLKQSTHIFANFTKEGKLEAGATITYHDYAKSFFLDSTISGTDNKDLNFLDRKMPGLKILKDEKDNPGDGEPLSQNIEFDYEPQESGEFYFINPQLLSLRKTNPFTRDKRESDIDFGCNQTIEISMHLGLPENFEVEALPKNTVVRSPDSSFAFTRITYYDKSNISFSQSLEIKKAVFSKTEYAGLHEFFKRIFGLMSEEIILKKKKS